ncbi:MAG: Nramp family divalent metal transporter [Pirellulaceae bacterium]
MSDRPARLNPLAIIGPGLVVAATGVGAGDLATGAFTGSKLGVAILWAVVLGAVLKFAVNEGLARWQLVTGETLLEGVARHLGRWAIALFLAYLVFWSYFVASILMSACGSAAHAIFPLFESPQRDKIFYGLLHSAVTVGLLRYGGYRWFERIMSGLVVVMFAVVVGSAIAIAPDWGQVVSGLLVPQIPDAGGQGVSWTIALMGGIGGTVTVLSYGYWIREQGRLSAADIRTCRLDLASGYGMTALFGLGMVIIGSELLDMTDDPSKGTTFIIRLAEQIDRRLGDWGWLARWGFVLGAWAAVYSSLLGVWQSVPLLFADAWRLLRQSDSPAAEQKPSTRWASYRWYQIALATIPAIGLWFNFVQLQKLNAIVGALFVPLLAAVLLLLNGRRDLLGAHRNAWLSWLVLVGALLFFAAAAVLEARGHLGG